MVTKERRGSDRAGSVVGSVVGLLLVGVPLGAGASGAGALGVRRSADPDASWGRVSSAAQAVASADTAATRRTTRTATRSTVRRRTQQVSGQAHGQRLYAVHDRELGETEVGRVAGQGQVGEAARQRDERGPELHARELC